MAPGPGTQHVLSEIKIYMVTATKDGSLSPCASHSTKHCMCIFSLPLTLLMSDHGGTVPYEVPMRYHHSPHFTEEQTEAQRGQDTGRR